MWTFDPKIPMSLWWALAVLSGVVVIYYAVRRQWSVAPAQRVLLTMMLGLGVVGPLLIALNPTWVETVPPVPGNPLLTVLIDRTMSMQTKDVGEDSQKSRWELAVSFANAIQTTNTNIEVRKLAIGDQVKPLSDQQLSAKESDLAIDDSNRWPQGYRSDIASALRQATRTGSPLGHAVVLISDGAHNVGSTESVLQAANEANALATPIHTLTLGTSIGMVNMSVTAKSSRMIAFPNNPISIRAIVSHNGLAGQSTEVQLLRDDEIVATKTVRLIGESTQEIRFELKDGVQETLERYRIVASDVPGEVTTADNQTMVLVQRLSAPIGVLVLEGKPYWDCKFLTRNLASDPVVDLTTIIKLGNGRYLKRKVEQESKLAPAALQSNLLMKGAPFLGPSFVSFLSLQADTPQEKSDDWKIEEDLPSPLESPELLDEFRLVILGRDADSFLTENAIEVLRDWISQRGGCLLCSRGAPADQVSSKLAEILPVRWSAGSESRYRAKVSRHGMDASIFDSLLSDGNDPLSSLPSLALGSSPTTRTGLPQVLLESTSESGESEIPIVTYQPFGSGQTIVVEGAGMWRWAFLPPQHADKDKIYPALWQAMVQWIVSQQDMMPGQDVAIRSDRATFISGDRATASIMVRAGSQWSTSAPESSISVLLQSSEMELPKRLSLSPSGLEGGLYRTDLGVLDVGYYTLKAVAGDRDEVLAASAFEVRDPWFERLEVDARPDLMRQIARLSGGQVLTSDDVPNLVSNFDALIKSQQKHEEIRTTVWDRPWVLVVILCGWIGTWIVRRQSGLV